MQILPPTGIYKKVDSWFRTKHCEQRFFRSSAKPIIGKLVSNGGLRLSDEINRLKIWQYLYSQNEHSTIFYSCRRFILFLIEVKLGIREFRSFLVGWIPISNFSYHLQAFLFCLTHESGVSKYDRRILGWSVCPVVYSDNCCLLYTSPSPRDA